MEWYNILFFSVLAIFIVKTILSLVFGDTDIDFDADGDVDFDISSMLSFKGILHFLLGFSSYLAAVAKYDIANLYFDAYKFSWVQYIFAVLIGLGFSYVLFELYKLMMKFNHYNDEILDVNNYIGTVLTNNGKVEPDTYSYMILVHTPIGSRKIIVLSSESDIKIGSQHKIFMNEQGIYCI